MSGVVYSWKNGGRTGSQLHAEGDSIRQVEWFQRVEEGNKEYTSVRRLS